MLPTFLVLLWYQKDGQDKCCRLFSPYASMCQSSDTWSTSLWIKICSSTIDLCVSRCNCWDRHRVYPVHRLLRGSYFSQANSGWAEGTSLLSASAFWMLILKEFWARTWEITVLSKHFWGFLNCYLFKAWIFLLHFLLLKKKRGGGRPRTVCFLFLKNMDSNAYNVEDTFTQVSRTTVMNSCCH